MGKPADEEDGFRMLSELRGRTHMVITGVCLIDIASGKERVFSETTSVTFTDISDVDLKSYLRTPEAYDKAGGYAIQGTFAKYIKSFDGSYENVVGFPWERIKKEIIILQEEL
jgi:septum formation protein